MTRALRGCLLTCWLPLLATLCCCVLRCDASDDNAFTIQHKKTNKCIQVKNLQILAGECHQSKEALWTWVSQHRLFNLGSRRCLGLNITRTSNSLKMVECDSNLILWWRCADDLILTANGNRLALKEEAKSLLTLTASKDSSDSWRRNNSSDVICKYPYHETYTREGNSYGKPCEFPFLFNNTWHYDCIRNDMFADGEWCSTTYNFNQDRKWGYCLKPEDGCNNTWEYDDASGSCYQLNAQASLSWKEAYISCQRQGGDLLSITNSSILSYFTDKDGIAEIFWIGLNQLDSYGGWEWSDHTPLSFVNWGPEMQNSSPLDGTSCVVMNADTGLWKSYPCEAALPYVCKKQFNKTKSEFPEVQDYMETQCDSDWLPHNGFCYSPMNNSASWEIAQQSCKARNGDLISIHSLADVELVVTKLHNETDDKMWIGFMNMDIPASFKWADGSEVVFTYWDQNEPNIPSNSTPNCVAYSGKLGRWKVLPCGNQLKYVCMKKGKILNETTSGKNCSQNEESKRHGNFCYWIVNNKASFGTECNLTIENRFEQEFINSLIRKHSMVEEKYFWTGLQDLSSLGEYSWGSVDGNIEKLTYTNWDSLQPEFSGGCVAMASRKHLGKWKVQSCSTFKAYSICKKYIGPPRPTEVLPKASDPCPPGWLSGSGLSCYKLFHKERVLRTRTWEEAERFCEALGGHLPSFNQEEEAKEFHNILRTVISDDRWVWVGLNKRNPDYLGSWQWSDNKPVSIVVMPREFQEDDYDVRDCAAFKSLRARRRLYWPPYRFEDRENFYLKPFRCDAKLEWVCQITKGTKIKSPEWYKPDEDGIHGLSLVIDGSEFWFVSDKNLSYQEAALYCSNNGSDLASLTSLAELTGVQSRLENLSAIGQNWWLKSVVPANHFHSWFPIYSDYHDHRVRDCWHISYRSWYKDPRINCNSKLPFICEKYNTSLLERHDPDYKPPNKKCPDGWQVFQNKCFRTIAPQYVTFKEANVQCETHGGFLPSIKSQAEQDFITSLIPSMPKDIWIGLQFLVKTQESKWTDGSELRYTNFHPLIRGRVRKVLIDLFDEDVTNQCGVLLNNPNSMYIGAWNLTSCADTHAVAICQRKQDAAPAENQTEKMLNITTSYLNVKYIVILKNLTWYDALQECQLNNMQLVSITEQYQQAFLAAKAAQYNYPLWIGLSSKDDGIHYRWSDGKHVRLSYWSEEEDEDVDDCVYLNSDGFWKTTECNAEKPGAVCYLPGNETKEIEAYESIQCPHKVKNTPWIPFQNSCYTFIITKDRWKEMKSNEAHHLCKAMNENASVLSIKNENENSFVVEQLHSFSSLAHWVWLGLIYEANDTLLKWYDGSHLSFNKWREGRPYIRNNNFVAGVNLDGLWDIYNYTDKWLPMQFHHYSVLVCKIEMEPTENKSPLPKKQLYRNNIYWILQKKLNWYEAWKECKQNGSDLASIHSESQQLFLEDVVKHDGFSLWLGLSSHDMDESDFEWSDGSSFDYKPWEYDATQSPGNCVFLNINGLWSHMKCTDVLDGAICYSPLEEKPSKPTESFTNCPKTTSGSSQWIQYNDYCYAFDVEFYNFSVYTAEQAEKVCQKLDRSATPLTIKDEKENAFVTKYLKQQYFITKRVWLGINPKALLSLRWLDGSDIKYTNWEQGHENASAKCGIIMSTSGKWFRTDCSKGASRVVCKVPQGSNKAGVVIAFAVIVVLAFVVGLVWFLYKKKQLHLGGFSSVRYERGLYEDESHSMFTRDDD